MTTTEARAIAFLKTLATLLEKAGRSGFYDRRAESWFAAGACAMARTPERALNEPCWDDLSLSGGGLSLLDCLRAARAPYDAARAEEEAEQEAVRAERERLRSDQDAWRALLQEHPLYARCEHLEQFGEPGAAALGLLLGFEERMDDIERAAFAALTRQLDCDPLQAKLAPAPVRRTPSDIEAVTRLAEAYRARQRERVRELASRYGYGPKLRHHHEHLAAGGLMGLYAWEHLEQDAAGDEHARGEQERLRIDYLAWREQETKRRKHDVSLSTRLTQGRAAVLALVDSEQLRVCRACDEIVYPSEPVSEPNRYTAWRPHREPARCHFCGAYDLEDWDERYSHALHYGGAFRPSDLDLRFAGIDGLMDDPNLPADEEELWR